MKNEDKEFLENLANNIDINSSTSSTHKIRHLFRFLLERNDELSSRVTYLEMMVANLCAARDDEEQ